ncbi:hypothetical protein C5167_013743, partial [Papaver somniferum]
MQLRKWLHSLLCIYKSCRFSYASLKMHNTLCSYYFR